MHYAYEREAGVSCVAALVTEVPELIGQMDNDKAYAVHLCVIKPDGMLFKQAVWRSDSNAPGTWHWPERTEA